MIAFLVLFTQLVYSKTEQTQKMSTELQTAISNMDNLEKLQVYVVIDDVDSDVVMNLFSIEYSDKYDA